MKEDLYRLEFDKLELSGREIKVFAATNIDELLDHLINKGDDHEDVVDERIPYFVELWPSAIRLAELLLDTTIDVRGKEVLELGCGSGLAGIAAGMAGAESVLMTDYLPDAIGFAANMWKLNLPSEPKTGLLDWRAPDITTKFEIILAADVAYEERNFLPLISTFHELLAPDGRIFLTEPSRQIAKPFVSLLEENGFELSTESSPVFHQNHRHIIQFHQITKTSVEPV